MYVCEHKVTFHFILCFDGTSAEEQAIRKGKKGPEEGGSVSSETIPGHKSPGATHWVHLFGAETDVKCLSSLYHPHAPGRGI